MSLFLIICFSLLGVGYIWPNNYTTSVVLYSDVTNIIEPLLKGRASVTEIDRSQQAREVIYSRSIIEKAGKEAGLINEAMTPEKMDRMVKSIRSRLEIKADKNNYFTVSYTSGNPDESFEMLHAITTVFMDNAESKKREESLGAFNFIDAQVQSYKRQLELAEEKLKEFKAGNIDGTEATVSSRIAQLRVDIETLDIGIEETESRRKTIERQLSEEGQYIRTKSALDELTARRQNLMSQLEKLLLAYQESYPDVVSVRGQIRELDAMIEQTKQLGEVYANNAENPLYEELRKQISAAEVDLRAQLRRRESLKRLLEQEHERAQRVAANQAQLSELTRDYNVTRDVYEEMLQRKESARLSMSLDQEGQGVTYRIQDPASFPLNPSGISYIHFALVAPFLGFLVPFGLIVVYVLADPHFRSSRILMQQMPPEVELLGVIPHYDSPMLQRILRKEIIVLVIIVITAGVLYGALSVYGYDLRM